MPSSKPSASHDDGPTTTDPARGRVLVVDDDEHIRRAFARVLEAHGHHVTTAANGREALERLAESSMLDAIVSDIQMPEMTGLELLRAVRHHEMDLPVILVTANPGVASAIHAVEYGAYRYLTKPVEHEVLADHVRRAITLRRMARLKRQALFLLGRETTHAADRAALEVTFERALPSLWMAYQPIVNARSGELFGYEALMRSEEASLPRPDSVLDAAERLGRLDDLGRKVRALAPLPMGDAGKAALFVNLHPRDLADDELYDAASPLGRIASRVVLEITERATLDEVSDVRERLEHLRAIGFRLAVDDLGAGYAGLSSFATLEPEIVKFDMTLIRGIDTNSVKRKVVDRMAKLAHDLGVIVVAEGVETLAERDVLVALGCDLLQGYLFAKPGKPFPAVSWAP